MSRTRIRKPSGSTSTTGTVRIGSNQREVRAGGYVILVSYMTPVAYTYEGGLYVTTEKSSHTTSKHINTWKAGRGEAQPISEKELDAVLTNLIGRSRLDPM